MKFPQRLAYYLLGLMIGLFAVFYFLDVKDTQFCYLPNCRVLKDIRNKPFHIDEDAKKHAEALSQEEIAIFLTHGDVDFSVSNVEHEGGKLYVIHGKDGKQQNMTFEIVNYADKAVLKKIIYN